VPREWSDNNYSRENSSITLLAFQGMSFFYMPSSLDHSVRDVPGLFCQACARSVPPSGYPPPPRIFGVMGLARNSPQNLHVKDLRGQNLDNKGLRSSVAVFVYSASALTIIRVFSVEGKAGCHMTCPVCVDLGGFQAVAENPKIFLVFLFSADVGPPEMQNERFG
jgi:hypothetical protein